jgi:hypothetical protein
MYNACQVDLDTFQVMGQSRQLHLGVHLGALKHNFRLPCEV